MFIGEPLHRLDIILDTDLASGDRRALLDTAKGVLRANMTDFIMRSTYEELLVEREAILEGRGFVIPEDSELSWSAHENNWNPAHETSMISWYGPEALFTSGSLVRVAEDKSGNKIDMYQTDTTQQPDLSSISLNGFKGMTFDGTEALFHDPAHGDSSLGILDSEIDVSEEGLTVAMLINYGDDENSSPNYLLGISSGSANPAGTTSDWNFKTRDDSSNTRYTFDWGNVNVQDDNATVPDGNDIIVFGTLSEYASRVIVNGGTPSDSGLSVLNDMAANRVMWMGGGVNGINVTGGFSGTIYEVILYRKHLTTDLQNNLEGYFAHKYNILSNLPSDHPYKSVSPKAKG